MELMKAAPGGRRCLLTVGGTPKGGDARPCPLPNTSVMWAGGQNQPLGPGLKVDVSRRCGFQLRKDLRDIDALIMRSMLSKDQAGGWNASYSTGA